MSQTLKDWMVVIGTIVVFGLIGLFCEHQHVEALKPQPVYPQPDTTTRVVRVITVDSCYQQRILNKLFEEGLVHFTNPHITDSIQARKKRGIKY